MSDPKKHKIINLGFGWYDIKTKFKQLLRRLTYSKAIQELICLIVIFYIRLVYFTSKVTFIGDDKLSETAKNNQGVIFSFWHNRLLMIPFLASRVAQEVHKSRPEFKFMSLASRHGDGKFIGRIMEKLKFVSVLGSTNDGRKKSRGIDLSSFRKIINGLKNNDALGITPDGPRGPNQKINSEIVNIARISGAAIFPISYSCSRFKELNSWDKFKFPLPFSKLCFYCSDPLVIDKDASKEDVAEMKNLLEEKMNLAQEESWKITQQS
jgi:lysophospholipid acyltransferase (LPLAT)-like uncharacterized protein